MKARVHVMLKNGVLDPQGAAVQHALGQLGFEGVNGVRQGKVIEMKLSETDEAAARAVLEETAAQYDLPTTDPVRFGVASIVDRIVAEFPQ